MINTDEIKLALQNGNDMELRFAMQAEILKVIDKSIDGEIGWRDFCNDIESIVSNGRIIGKNNWKE